VLRPCSGRCVLLMNGFRRLEDVLAELNSHVVVGGDAMTPIVHGMSKPRRIARPLLLEEKRAVAIGGDLAYALTLRVE